MDGRHSDVEERGADLRIRRHEGNYAMTGILGGARAAERAAEEAAKKAAK
jgi:hypothetical protein